ncbi:MAG: LDL receptor domain-containing protein [Myxococcota bacterium]
MRDSLLVTLIGACWVCVAVGCDSSDTGSIETDVPPAGSGQYATTQTGGADDPNGVVTEPEVEVEVPDAVDPDVPGEDVPECVSDAECMNQVEMSTCQEVTCAAATGTCVLTTLPDGTSCDAGDPCVTNGACAQGTCIGQALNCDDGDPCTDASCNPGSGCVYEHNTAPCDDGDPCTTGDACSFGNCAASAMVDCDDDNPCTSDSCDPFGGCQNVPNNALCDDGDPCTLDICSGGSCVGTPDPNAEGCGEPSGCQPSEIENCEGGCTNALFYGDGVCNPELNCQSTQFDGGDCDAGQGCGPGQMVGCDGVCTAEWQLGNGVCDPALDCALHEFDGGDCATTGGCAPGQITACDGSCAAEWQLGNAICDPSLDCAEYDFDGGDCAPPSEGCPVGELEDCFGACVGPEGIMALANGICDPEFNCAEYVNDGGDCDEPSSCAFFEVENCDGGCTLGNWYADNQCDEELFCEETDWDGGDCLGVCPYTQYQDCLGECHEDDSAVENGVCDEAWNCAEYGMDGGDCGPMTCEPGELLCPVDQTCIPESLFCDGVKDCFGGWDELDCEPVSSCASYEVDNCQGGCTLESWLGDAECDDELNCPATDWDGGDCLAVCTAEEFEDCLGGCHLNDEGVANGICDEAWNCAAYDMDGGDCGTLGCTADQFTCVMSGVCISNALVCNGVKDCGDLSDEEGCEPVSNCASYEVDDCDGGCTLASWLGDNQCDPILNCIETAWDSGDCDGVCSGAQVQDCLGGCQPDGDKIGNGICDPVWDCAAHDMDGGDCVAVGCGVSEFECVATGVCISKSLVCNGTKDCGDLSDEEGCEPVSNCASYEVDDCDGGCTLASWLGDNECDPILDCAETAWDSGDCSSEGTGCAPDELACPGGFICVAPAAICDGWPDCASGDDEMNCDGGGSCGVGELLGCNGSCYSATWFGDGACDIFLDCAETGWDTGDCDASGSCTPGQFQCADGDCLAISWQCDGWDDCAMGEDEVGCTSDF